MKNGNPCPPSFSEYGEKCTPEEAQYAIDNLE
ncbi:Ltp family lipoprotein [Cytobacillus sp. FJAT-54145]|uniref:Ltp family lipoprotein n=1 Tax=Cytobacillus spartinae TaxID=3299023 RepID=A0ABW6KBD2_9BACI